MEGPEETTLQNQPITNYDLLVNYWNTISQVTGLIKASELKAGLILSFYGILLNFVYNTASTLLTTAGNHIILWIFIFLWSLSTAISVFFCMRCFIPKIERQYDRSIFFFGDVVTKFGSIKEFADIFYSISKNEDLLFKQLGEQIFVISKIASWKFKNVHQALRFLAIALVFLFLTLAYFGILVLS